MDHDLDFLRAEHTELSRMLADTLEVDVLDRLSIQDRLDHVRREILRSERQQRRRAAISCTICSPRCECSELADECSELESPANPAI